MADETSKDDKTEAATPQRLQKAREEGQIARSKELSTFLMLLGGITALWSLGTLMKDGLILVMEQSMHFERDIAYDTTATITHMMKLFAEALKSLAPLFVIMLVLALIAPALLGGWNFSSKALAPKISKLNPLKGLKKIFSMQSITELLKAIAKSVLVGTIAYFFLKAYIPEIMGLSRLTLEMGLASMLKIVVFGCGLMILSLLIVVLMDVPYQLFSHSKQLKMSLQDIKQEHKESEGDPHLKAKIRSQQQAIARSRMMSNVPTADVIVTNPTHFAVALSYQEGDNGAPKVVAKGADAIAAKIREVGAEHRIPVLSAPKLARALYWHVDLDREIPAALYSAVAEVLAWVYQIKQIEKEGGEKPQVPTDLPVPKGMDERPSPAQKRKGFDED